jgi:serine phosphatase RsbU (regulator of sigma subunit)
MSNHLLAGRRELLSYRRALADQRERTRLLHQMIQPARGTAHDVNGMRVDVRCTTADPALPVGDDWYLSMPMIGGDLILAVGDAVGHGLSAAATMVRMRFATAAFAAQGHSPGVILTKLNTMLCRKDTDSTATSVIVRYRPDGTVTWARAGHPPILLANRHGVRQLPNPTGPLLGVFPAPRYTQLTRRLTPGDRLLLYTDGIIRRGLAIDDGIRQIEERLTERLGSSVPLLDQLEYRASHDDACVLVAERLR